MGWVWCAARLFVRAASGRQRYNVLGALNAVTHELIRVTNDGYITAETVCELLRKISALQLPTPVTLVLDNARYQRCKLVQAAADPHRGILYFRQTWLKMTSLKQFSIAPKAGAPSFMFWTWVMCPAQ